MTSTKQPLRNDNSAPKPTSYTEVTRLHRGALSHSKGSMVITATSHQEGASLSAELIALRSAENGTKTLLVDLNTFNATITKEFKMERAVWALSSRGEDDMLEDLIQQTPKQKNLYILPAPADDRAAEILKDPRKAAHFFTVLEKQFDHIIVDTTPVLALNRRNADPIVLAAAARRCALVLMAGVTQKAKIKQAIKTLRESGANIEGVIVNDYKNPSLKDKLQALVNRLSTVAPSLHSWLTYRIQKNNTL